MATDVFPPSSGAGTTSLTPFTGPVLTVPSAINQQQPSAFTAPASGQTSTFVCNNALYGGNSYATATLHLRAGGLGATGVTMTLWGSDDAQANWTPMSGINALTGLNEAILVMPPNSTAMWYIPVAGLSVIQARVLTLTSGGFFASWTGSAAGIISPPTVPPTDVFAARRDVTLMVRSHPVSSSLALAPFDVMQENDDKTRTFTSAVTSRANRPGRRFWVQAIDGAYSPANASDRGKVVLVSKVNGAVAANSDPKFEMALLTAPGRSIDLSSPLEFPATSAMNVGIAAMGSVGLGLLTATVYGFETL